jgi:hypothetical protein
VGDTLPDHTLLANGEPAKVVTAWPLRPIEAQANKRMSRTRGGITEERMGRGIVTK